MPKGALLLLLTLFTVTGCTSGPTKVCNVNEPRWAAYYEDDLPADAFKNMDLVVFDRLHHPAFGALKGKVTVLAYISLGEVAEGTAEFKTLDKEGIILAENPVWQTHVVDIASPIWQRVVLEKVRDAADQGFDGVMLDTLDGPLEWAKQQGSKRENTTLLAAVELIQKIHKDFPHMQLMLNRGFDVLPFVATQINSVLAESILVKTDVSSGHFTLFSRISFDQAATQLHRATIGTSHLQIYTLDYWNGDDVDGLEYIYAAQRAQGFIPYVTTPDLRHFTPEPCA